MRNFESIGLILIGAVSFLILLFVLTEGIVEAHFLGYDSVDDCEIRWDDHTKYDRERRAAQRAWEALKADDDCVDLEPDTWYTLEGWNGLMLTGLILNGQVCTSHNLVLITLT